LKNVILNIYKNKNVRSETFIDIVILMYKHSSCKLKP